jgi:hypothetical protein
MGVRKAPAAATPTHISTGMGETPMDAAAAAPMGTVTYDLSTKARDFWRCPADGAHIGVTMRQKIRGPFRIAIDSEWYSLYLSLSDQR